MSPMPLNAASFTFITLGLAILAGAAGVRLHFASRAVPLWPAGLAMCAVAGLVSGVVQPLGVGWVLLLCLAGWWHRLGRQPLLSGVCLGVLALAMALHALPGFRNLPWMVNITLASEAIPFSLYANVDKGIAGLCLWMLGTQSGDADERGSDGRGDARLIRTVLMHAAVTVVGVMALAVASGVVRLEPRWTVVPDAWAVIWPFLLVNLLFTCVAEEAFFRGLLQGGLTRWMAGRPAWSRFAGWLPIGLCAVLFGMAHAGGGWRLAVLATVAGLGYGLVWARTRRVGAAVAVHFAVNAVHFLFFTYPRLA